MVKQSDKPARRKSAKKRSKAKKVRLVIKRHPFGIVLFYFSIVVVFLLLAFIFSIITNGSVDILGAFSLGGASKALLVSIASLIVVVSSLVICLAAFKIYYSNFMIIDNEKVAIKARHSLFETKQSYLGLANIEDVTANKNTFIENLLDFGVICVETAGEQENFKFKYCPKPYQVADELMKIREEYLQKNQVVFN